MITLFLVSQKVFRVRQMLCNSPSYLAESQQRLEDNLTTVASKAREKFYGKASCGKGCESALKFALSVL
jgi:hypothetical protein